MTRGILLESMRQLLQIRLAFNLQGNKGLALHLKFIIDGSLVEIVQKAWPNLDEDLMAWDYENRYEWAWVALPEHDIRLNISREHEWGEEPHSYPLFIAPFKIDADIPHGVIPGIIVQHLVDSFGCDAEVFATDTPGYDSDAAADSIVTFTKKPAT